MNIGSCYVGEAEGCGGRHQRLYLLIPEDLISSAQYPCYIYDLNVFNLECRFTLAIYIEIRNFTASFFFLHPAIFSSTYLPFLRRNGSEVTYPTLSITWTAPSECLASTTVYLIITEYHTSEIGGHVDLFRIPTPPNLTGTCLSPSYTNDIPLLGNGECPSG